MKIIIIPAWYNSPSRPTLGSFFKEQAEALATKGHNVIILYPGLVSSRDLFKFEKCYKQYKENGVQVYRIDTPALGLNRFSRLDSFLWKVKLKKLYKIAVKENGKPDIIHAHSCLWAGYAATEVLKNENVPIIVTEHSTAFQKMEIEGYKRKCVCNTVENATGFIAVSNDLKKYMNEYNKYKKEIKVIPNMVSDEIMKSKIEPKTLKSSEKFKFLSVCYLTHKKGIDILLNAFKNAFKENDDVELIIGGDGEEFENLNILSKSLKIENKVKFLGTLNRQEVAEKMTECDVFVLPSRFETFGVVFIEALSLGKPIIASKAGGPNDIVNNQNGILVEVEDVDGLADAMINMKSKYDNYNEEIIRQDCYNRFSEKAVISQIENYYSEVINGGQM